MVLNVNGPVVEHNAVMPFANSTAFGSQLMPIVELVAI